MFDISQLEAALAASKEEIDELTGTLNAVRNSAKELKPLVTDYNDKKQK